MKNFRRLTAVFAVLSATVAVASAVTVGCSSDDTVTTGDSGTDQANPPPPPPNDSGNDSATDAGVDVVVPPDLAGFADSMTDAICTRFAQCCAQTDGGPFDKAVCAKSYRSGWELSGADYRTGVDAAAVNYDQAKAKDCLTKLLTFSCPVLGAPEFKAMTQSCFAAASGKLPAGSPCHGSVECTTTTWCDLTDAGDAGVGSCANLLAANANCAGKPNEACSYRAQSGFCDSTTKKCTGLLPNGANCSDTAASSGCQSGECDDNYQCGTSVTIVYPPFGDPKDGGYVGFCEAFAPDGG